MRRAKEYITIVGTKMLWPRKRDIAISYCRILLHDTMLNKDSHRTGTSDTPICVCRMGEETVTHLLFHCGKYNEARSYLNDTLNEIVSSYDVKFTLCDKLQILLAPPCDDNITKS